MKKTHKIALLVAVLLSLLVLTNQFVSRKNGMPHVEINVHFQISVNGNNDLRKES